MSRADAVRTVLAGLPALEPGHVWLAGAGPGGPEHLTLQALAGLLQADAVVYDALVDDRVLALADPAAERIFAGKRGGKPSAAQSDIAARLIALADAGRRVLRLKGGDPFVFGRGGEEVLTLAAHGVPFRVIPGITAGLAGLAAASIPATLRGVNQAIIFATGHCAEDQEPASIGTRSPAWASRSCSTWRCARSRPSPPRLSRAVSRPRHPVAVIASAATPEERILITTLARSAGGRGA